MRILTGILTTCLSLAAMTSYAESNQELSKLLTEVKEQTTSEANVNGERLANFKAKLAEQDSLLQSAMLELTKEKARAESLKKEFDTQEAVLTDLEKKLELTMGTLGEMYGVVRQVAADTYANFEGSITSLQNQDRLSFLKKISGKKELATGEQLRRLWFEMLSEMNNAGQVASFKTAVTLANGKTEEMPVVRIGAFNLISGDKYLQYLPETAQVTVLKRQPESAATAQAAMLASGEGAFTEFYIDPTRGVLLSKMVNAPSLSERIEQGGIVGYVILVVLVLGFIIVAERVVRLTRVSKAIENQLATKEILPNNPLGKIFAICKKNTDNDVESLEIKLHEAILKTVSPMEKGISTVKILAAIAPLLGLLGTVTGMIGTFQSITLFGTGDPKLMAGGISQALVTTVLGLVAAIPLILLHSFVASRCKKVSSVLEEQAAGLLVERIEAREA